MNTQPQPGRFGWDYISNAVAQTGTWFAIVCLSGTVFATLTDVGPNTRAGAVASTVFPAGLTIYGAFTNFTLTSGAVIGYRSRDLIANP